MSTTKKCWFVDGELQHIGEWENAPEDAVSEDREVVFDPAYGWRIADEIIPPTELEMLQQKVAMQDNIIEELMFVIIPELLTGGTGGE